MTKYWLLELRRLSVIRRYQLIHTTVHQSVADHSFHVTLIAMAVARDLCLSKDTLVDLLERTLLHDAAEVLVGDIPWHIKRHSSRFHEALKEVETDLVQNSWCGPFGTPDTVSEHVVHQVINCKADRLGLIVSWADMAELALFVSEELERCNTSDVMGEVFGRANDFLRSPEFDPLFHSSPTVRSILARLDQTLRKASQ